MTSIALLKSAAFTTTDWFHYGFVSFSIILWEPKFHFTSVSLILLKRTFISVRFLRHREAELYFGSVRFLFTNERPALLLPVTSGKIGCKKLKIKLYSSGLTFLGRLSVVFLMKKNIRSWKYARSRIILKSPNGQTGRNHQDSKLEEWVISKVLETRAASESMVKR